MKHFFLIVTAAVFFCGCKKADHATGLIGEAKDYFDSHPVTVSSSYPRFAAARTVDWGHASVIPFKNSHAVIAPVQYPRPFYMASTVDTKRFYNSNENTWLCMYKDSLQNYHTEQVAFFPDSNFQKYKPFTGLIAVDEYAGNALKKFQVVNNNRILQGAKNYKAAAITENGTTENLLAVIETCYTIDQYNYSVDDPDNGVYTSEPAGCDYSIISDGGDGAAYGGIASGGGASGGGGGGSGISPASSFSVLSGNNTIANIVDYNKCFTNMAGSGNTFSVTVCVEQPDPGTRTAWVTSASGAAGSSGTGNPVNVGHTFLIFTQHTGSGTITRNVGFYPKTSVDPWSPSAQGMLNDNEGDSYDISLSVTVTNSQFFNMLGYLSQGNNTGFDYNLNTNNCTTFALNTLSAGNINLPRTTGSWIDGSGNDPGDLGEDIRNLNLSSNMTRSTSDPAHPNQGNCN